MIIGHDYCTHVSCGCKFFFGMILQLATILLELMVLGNEKLFYVFLRYPVRSGTKRD